MLESVALQRLRTPESTHVEKGQNTVQNNAYHFEKVCHMAFKYYACQPKLTCEKGNFIGAPLNLMLILKSIYNVCLWEYRQVQNISSVNVP